MVIRAHDSQTSTHVTRKRSCIAKIIRSRTVAIRLVERRCIRLSVLILQPLLEYVSILCSEGLNKKFPMSGGEGLPCLVLLKEWHSRLRSLYWRLRRASLWLHSHLGACGAVRLRADRQIIPHGIERALVGSGQNRASLCSTHLGRRGTRLRLHT